VSNTYNQLNQSEQTSVRNTALEWYQKHKSHVYQVIAEDKTQAKIAPTGSDLFNPHFGSRCIGAVF
jgi:hypothetical protein